MIIVITLRLSVVIVAILMTIWKHTNEGVSSGLGALFSILIWLMILFVVYA